LRTVTVPSIMQNRISKILQYQEFCMAATTT
jgi:hypothetical protein